MNAVVIAIIIAITGVVAAAVLLAKGAGPDSMWRGGRAHLVRGIFFREDGSWSPSGRITAILFWLVVASIAYLLVHGLCGC